jgi:hypothetical protein
MQYDLANRRNTLRRRSWLLLGCAVDELRASGFLVGFPSNWVLGGLEPLADLG